MKKFYLLLAMLMLTVSSAWADATVTWSQTPMTYDEFVALAGTSKTFGLQAVSTNAATYKKWFGFTSATSRVDNITTQQLFTLEGTANAAQFKRVSDGQYLSGAGSFGTTAIDVNLVNRTAGDYASEFTSAMQISIDNGSSQHYNANSYAFAGGTGGWSAYVAYRICNVKSVKFLDNDGNELAAEQTDIFLPEGALPHIFGYIISVDPTDGAGISGEGPYVFKFQKDPNAFLPTLPADKPYLKVGEKANTITPVSEADDNSHWYLMTQIRNGESPMYDNGTSTIKRAAASVGTDIGINVSGNEKYLVRFVTTEYNGVYKIQFATGRFIQTSLTTGEAQDAGLYFVYNINNENTHIAWNKTTDGTTKTDRVDNNGAGNSISFWGSGEITETGGNNDWSVYPIEFVKATVDNTYEYYDGETLLGSYIHTDLAGEAPSGARALPSYVTLVSTTAPESCGNESATFKYYTSVSNLPFTTDGTYYNLAINRTPNLQIYATEGVTNEIQTQNVAKTAATVNYYMWSFEGDWFNGFAIKNRVADAYVSFGETTDPSDKTKATLVSEKQTGSYFDLTIQNSMNYFSIHGTTNYAFISNNGGSSTTYLTNWNSANNLTQNDNGAQIIITKAEELANMHIQAGAKWGTFCAPFDVTIPDGVQAYTGQLQDNNTWIRMTELENTIPANTGVVVWAKNLETMDGDWNFMEVPTTAEGKASCYSKNLTGAIKTVEEGDYLLQIQNDVVGWYRVPEDNSYTLAPNRCYLVVPEPNQVRPFIGFEPVDDATGINSIATEAKTKADGKYMVNGQIVVVKAGKAYNMSGAEIK